MNALIIGLSAMFLCGCGGDTVVYEERNVTNGEIVLLEDNQTIGYKPNTNVQIVNLQDGSYYISCDYGQCPIHIGDTTTITNTDINNSKDITTNLDQNKT